MGLSQITLDMYEYKFYLSLHVSKSIVRMIASSEAIMRVLSFATAFRAHASSNVAADIPPGDDEVSVGCKTLDCMRRLPRKAATIPRWALTALSGAILGNITPCRER